MRPRCLLTYVDRLPTISESQEFDFEDGEVDSPGCSMDEYMDSIRELSQQPQPCYPLHGPLRGHRRFGVRAVPCSLLLHSPGTSGGASSSVALSDVTLSVRGRASRYSNLHVVDRLVAQTVFAGL